MTSKEQSEAEAAASTQDRHCLVALWKPTQNPWVRKLEPSLEGYATKAEEEADEAICVVMEDDGSLTVRSSKHSVIKSLAVLGVKLCIVWPLGLAGALGIVKATTEIEAATRKRNRTGATDDELACLMEKMKPGWCAFVAIYKEFLVPAMVHTCMQLGAVAVWDGKESIIEDMIKETKLEEDLVEKKQAEGKVRILGSSGGLGGGGGGLQYGTSMDKPEDKTKRCYSGYLAKLGQNLCCCCTCVVAQLSHFL